MSEAISDDFVGLAFGVRCLRLNPRVACSLLVKKSIGTTVELVQWFRSVYRGHAVLRVRTEVVTSNLFFRELELRLQLELIEGRIHGKRKWNGSRPPRR